MDLDGFRALSRPEGVRLLASLPPYDEAASLGLAERLRRHHDPTLVSAALTQSRLRARARAKLGPDADRMFFTPDGLEQATRARVADHRARHVAASGVTRVVDLCCGVGGDLVAIARAGVEVVGVDRDPLTCAVAAANVEALGLTALATVICGDVTVTDVTGFDAAFCDPARRGRGGRVFDPDAYSPPLVRVLDVVRQARAAGVKVAPGIPHDRVPDDAQAEWVSDEGDVKEAVLWFGDLRRCGDPRPAGRAATLLPSGERLSADPGLGPPPVGPVGRYLYEPDGAVIRAGLVAEVAARVGGRLVDPTIAYVTADALTPTPFATAYEVTDVLPFGVKRLRTYLRERGVGTLTVKKRGSAVEPERLRRQLRLAGPAEATVVVTRVAGAPTVLVVGRLPPAG